VSIAALQILSAFNSLTNERVYCTRYATRDEAIADLFDYIEPFHNHSRRHSTLGGNSPARFLENWISAQHAQELAGHLVGRRIIEGSSLHLPAIFRRRNRGN